MLTSMRTMELRCVDSRPESMEEGQFLSEIGRTERSVGVSLEVAEIEEVSNGTLLATHGETVHREIMFRLRTATVASQPMHVVTVLEDGEERLCGYMIGESVAVRDRLHRMKVGASTTHVDDLQAPIEEVEQRFTKAVANAVSTNGSDHTDEVMVEGWSTYWRTGDFGGISVAAYRFENSAAAKRASADLVGYYASDASTIFSVSTWLQPADRGDQLDVAVAVYDDVVYWIGVSPLVAADDHDVVDSAQQSSRLDRGSISGVYDWTNRHTAAVMGSRPRW